MIPEMSEIYSKLPEEMEIGKLHFVVHELRKLCLEREVNLSRDLILQARVQTHIQCCRPCPQPDHYLNCLAILSVKDYNNAVYCLREYRYQLEIARPKAGSDGFAGK